jgi:hypothetical protein
MRVLLGLLAYLLAASAIVGSVVGFLFLAVEPGATAAPAPQEARKVGPRIQQWLDRKAEARIYAERERAAALAEKERLDARRRKVLSIPEHAAFARAPDHEGRAAERENAAQRRENAKREAKRSRQRRDAEPAGLPQASYRQSLQYYPDIHGRSQ